MNYSEAISKSVHGAIIRRKDGNKDEFVFYKSETMMDEDEINTLPISGNLAFFLSSLKKPVSFQGYFCLWKDGKVHGGWRPSANDLQSEWEVVRVDVSFPTMCSIKVTSEEN